MKSRQKNMANELWVVACFCVNITFFSASFLMSFRESFDWFCSICSKSVYCLVLRFEIRLHFLLLLLLLGGAGGGVYDPVGLRASACLRRRNSAAQSRLYEVVSDDSRQHVLDYAPLFSWRDSNATWQCQQHCFLQQKEWWLAICISDLES